MGGRSSAELKARETNEPSTRLEPFNFEEPSFDPNYGFPNGRKPRGNFLFILRNLILKYLISPRFC